MPREKKTRVPTKQTIYDLFYFAAIVRDRKEANELFKIKKLKVNGKVLPLTTLVSDIPEGFAILQADGQTREVLIKPGLWE